MLATPLGLKHNFFMHVKCFFVSYPLDVTAILFVVDCSNYNSYLKEDQSKVHCCIMLFYKCYIYCYMIILAELFGGSYGNV